MRGPLNRAALPVLALILGLAGNRVAAQTANISVTGLPATPLIGEQICSQVSFSNTGGPTGYGPYLIGVVDEDITVTTVSFVDVTPVIELVGQFDASQTLIDPISGQPISGPENGSAYVVRYPIGSLDPGNDPLELEVCGFVGPGAEIGVPLEVDLIPGFEFGDTPTGDTGAVLNTGGTFSSTVTPQLARVQKTNTAPEDERPPGPSHEFAYTYRVDVSQLVAIDDFVLVDPLPAQIQWTGAPVTVAAPLGLGCSVNQALLNAPPTPSGVLDVRCNRLLGTQGTSDLLVTLPVYISDILNEAADDQQTITNQVDIAYTFKGDGFTDFDTSNVLALHAAIQKGASGNPLPGNKLTYSIDFQVTDFTTGSTPFVISDVLPDGLAFDTTVALTVNGALVPITAAVSPGPGPGQTALVWDVSAATGNALPASATGRLRYQATILNVYSDGVTPVQASDVLSNSASLNYTLNEGAAGSNGSGATATITPNSPDKTVQDPNPLPPQLSPGQEITFRLSLDIPAGNTSSVVLKDLLPRPVFDVADFDTATDWTVQPPFQALTPVVTTAATDNSVTFDFGDIQSPSSETLIVDLRATITGEPFADDLFLTNLFSSSYENAVGETFTGLQAAGITVGAPDLSITRGVLFVANPRAQILPAPPADPSLELADSDARDADGFDEVTYLITVENIGGQAAFDVNLTETIIPQQTCNPSVSVVNGTGVTLTFSGSILDPGGITLDMPLPGNDRNPAGGGAPFGADTALITLRCELADGVTPAETVSSTSSVQWLSTQAGSDTFPTRSDDASVIIARPQLSKRVIAVAPNYASRADRVHIGELLTYQLDIRVPEGVSPDVQVEDLLDNGLAHVDILSITANSSALSSSVGDFNTDVRNTAAFLQQAAAPEGIDRRLIFGPGPTDNGFGTVTNRDRDNATDEIVSLVYRARVLNSALNVRGQNRNNRARWGWKPADISRQTEQVNAANVRIVEPELRINRLFLPDTGDEDQPPVVRLTLEHTGASNADTFDVELRETLPAELVVVGGTSGISFGANCPAAAQISLSSLLPQTLSITWLDYPEASGQCVIEFPTAFDFLGTIAGEVLVGCADVTYQSLSSRDQPLPGTPNGNTIAVERTGDAADPGGNANTYRDESCDAFQVFDVGVVKDVSSTNQTQTDNIPGTPPGFESLTIGEIVNFDLVLTIPDTTATDLVVTDLLPTNGITLELLSSAITRVGSDLVYDSPGGTPVDNDRPAPVIDDANGDGINDRVVYDFGAIGDIDKTVDDGINRDDRIRIDVEAKVRDVAGNVNNAVAPNVALVTFGPDGGVTDHADLEIVEPLLDVVKTADLTEVEAGDTITYTVTTRHNTNSRVAAQQVAISDALPPDLTLVPGSVQLGGLCTQAPDVGPTETGDGFTATWNSFDLGAICEIQMQAQVDIAAVTGERIINTAELTWTSLSTTGDADDRPYDNSNGWEVVVSAPGLAKELIGTDQGATRFQFGAPSSELTIGETATFEVVADFPDGTSREVVIEDNLPINDVALRITRAVVARVGGDLSLSSGIAAGDSAGACNPALDSCARFLLGDVVNQPDSRPDRGDLEDQVVFEIDAIVLNDDLNNGAPGTDKGLLNQADLTSPDASLIATEPFDIVEPRLTLQKLNDDASVGLTEATQKERFVLRISHQAISTATARSIVVTDNLDNATTQAMLGQDPNDADFEPITSTCPGFTVDSEPGVGANVPGFAFSFDSLTLGQGSCVIAYSVDMSPTLTPLPGVFVNDASLAWESAPGSAQSRQYSSQDQVLLFAFNQAAVLKSVRTTSLPETGTGIDDGFLEDVAIGEIVEFEIIATFDEGVTENVVVSDEFQSDANGVFEFVGGSIDFIGRDITFSGTGAVTTPTPNSIAIAYGDVTNAGDGIVDENDTIRYTLRLRVAVDPANSDDGIPLEQLNNTATISYTGGIDPSSSAFVEIVEPDLALTKSFTEVADGVATIELTLANNGNAPAFDILGTDEFDETLWVPGSLVPVRVPTGFELVESAPVAGVFTVSVRVANPSVPPTPEEYIAPGQSDTVIFTLALRNDGQPQDSGGNPVTTIPNTATVEGSSLPGDLPDQNDPDSEERSYTVQASDNLTLPALVFEKTWTATTTPPEPGQSVTYTVTAENTGDAPLTEVALTDTPDNVRGSFVVGSVTINAGGNSDTGTVVSGNTSGDTSIGVEFARIDAGATVAVTYAVRIPSPYPDAQAEPQRLVNQATLISRELPDARSDDPTTTAPDDATIVPIAADPIMTIVKTDNGAVGTAGSFITYDLTIGNAGNQDASGVVVTDTVPSNTTFVPSLSSRGWRCADVAAGSRCEFQLLDVPANTTRLLQFVVRVNAPLASGVTEIVNSASVSEDGSENADNPNPPLVPGPPSTDDATDTTPLIALPILRVDKDDGGIAVAPGDRYVYRIRYENIGNQQATNVLLTEEVPDFVVFDAATSSPGWSCTDGSPPTTQCVLGLGTVSPGPAATVDFGLRVIFPAAAGANFIDNAVEINDDGNNSAGFVLRDRALDNTPLIAVPDLVIAKSTDAGTVRIDDVIRYLLRYDNVGNQDATGVVVREIVPAGSVFLRDESAPTTWSCSDRDPGGSICQTVIGNLGASNGGTLSFAVQVVQQNTSQELVNVAETNNDGTNGLDPTPSNNITRLINAFPIPSIPALPRLLLWGLVVLIGLWGLRAAHRRRPSRVDS